jgi:hypothetical protein
MSWKRAVSPGYTGGRCVGLFGITSTDRGDPDDHPSLIDTQHGLIQMLDELRCGA